MFPALVSYSPAGLASAQKPFPPGTAPKRTCPFGQCGASFPVRAPASLIVAGFAVAIFFPLARVSDLPLICLLPSRARIPSAVTVSPTLTMSRVQPLPLRLRSSVLSYSPAQLVVFLLVSRTSIHRKTWGLVQSNLVTVPRRVMGFLSSYSAAMEWCPHSGAIARLNTRHPNALRLIASPLFPAREVVRNSSPDNPGSRKTPHRSPVRPRKPCL